MRNIELSEEMYGAGYKNITNIDISEVVINKMKSEYSKTIPELKCIYILQ